MRFWFTIYNTEFAPDGVEVAQPDGWKDAAIMLERHEKFYSLIEYFEAELIWYGSAMKLFNQITESQGPDALTRLVIDYSIKTGVRKQMFDGLIDHSLLEEHSKGRLAYKMKVPVIRNDFWAKFINRMGTPVDLMATTDLDGNERLAVSKITKTLPTQIIRQQFIRDSSYNNSNEGLFQSYTHLNAQANRTYYLLFDNAYYSVKEIKEQYEYGTQISELNPTEFEKYVWKVTYGGEYSGQIKIRYSLVSSTEFNSFTVKWYHTVRKNGVLEPATEFHSNAGVASSSFNGLGSFYFEDANEINHSFTYDLNAGDEIFIWGEVVLAGGASQLTYFSDYDLDKGAGFSPRYTEFNLQGNTIYQTTSTDAYLLPDAFESVLSKITGRDDVLQSELFEGCQRQYALMKGLHVRGYSMEEKPFTVSFNDLWDGADPCLNLGLTYGEEKIIIENKSTFFDKVPVVNLSNIFGVVRKYDNNQFPKTIEYGFETWQAESESGIDDPQTKGKRRTRFATIGKDVRILSKFVAASLAIEQTRRNRVEAGKDWRMDENIMIIALNDLLEVETGAEFESVQNVLNADTRYNLRLTASRCFSRWLPVFNGGLNHTLNDPATAKYFFASGEGNFDAITSLNEEDCEYGSNATINEKQDINVGTDFIQLPKLYQFRHPMTMSIYEQIRANRNKALGLSKTNESHTPHFIQKFKYFFVKGFAEIEVTLGEQVTEGSGFRLLEDEAFILQQNLGLIELE